MWELSFEDFVCEIVVKGEEVEPESVTTKRVQKVSLQSVTTCACGNLEVFDCVTS